METAVTLLTIVCYGSTFYLWWYLRTPVFFFALLAGHVGAIISPLWPLLYQFSYSPGLTVSYSLGGLTLFKPVVLASAWFYPLPALVVFLLYRTHWWFSGYLTALITGGIFLGYHLVMEWIGLMFNIWSYTVSDLPFGVASWFLSVLMAALVSLALLYIVLLVFRYPWYTMLMVLLPTTLLLNLLVRGLLGAPIWISLLFRAESWAANIGLISTLALLAWGVHIVAWGISRVNREIVV